ncbi:MAG: choice-of-anchor Q domain-containing protein [Lysobacterales bacterium]
MSARSLTASHRPDTRASRGLGWHVALGLLALSWAAGAQAYITVGPDGTFPTIQEGVDQAIANGGDEVRVENLGCIPPHCSYYNENVDFVTSVSVSLSGGWDSIFQSQTAGATSEIRGVDGNDAPTISAIVQGDAIVSINRFALNGSGNSFGFYTRGLLVGARDNASVVVADNFIYGNVVYTSTTSLPQGGAGLAVQASGASVIALTGNTIDTNQLLGTDSAPSFGAGAFVQTTQSGHIDFVLNMIYDNITSNPNGGACRGGGVFTDSEDTSSMELRGNNYTGNEQIFCTNGATGDAANVSASTQGIVSLYEETWTNNNIPSDPGVYQVYFEAHDISQIFAANGLITNGTWGGLFAGADATAFIDVSNYTVTGNPAVGVTAYGAGTQIWNTLMWNNSGDEDPHDGASFWYSLVGVDPLFIDAANGNYRLSTGSPAIDSGSNSPAGGLRPWDLDLSPRPYNGVSDIGAYEYQGGANDRIFADGFDG